MRWLVVVVALACGCTQSPAEDVQTVIQTYCDCETPNGTTTCVATLTPLLTSVTDGCTSCVYDYESSCNLLEANCTSLCFPPEVTNDGP